MTPEQMLSQPAPPPAEMSLGADFIVDPNNPQVGLLVFQIARTSYQIGMPSAGVVGFLRALADGVEAKLQAVSPIVRPPSGLFLPK